MFAALATTDATASCQDQPDTLQELAVQILPQVAGGASAGTHETLKNSIGNIH